MTDTEVQGGPALLAEGTFAFFASPDGGRVIRWQAQGGAEEFIALPAEMVPALEALRANPAALLAIAASPMGGIARKMAQRMISKGGE